MRCKDTLFSSLGLSLIMLNLAVNAHCHSSTQRAEEVFFQINKKPFAFLIPDK